MSGQEEDNYFDFLPRELNDIIASYFITKVESNLDKILTIVRAKDYRHIFQMAYPEYYEVAQDEILVSGNINDWKEVLLHFTETVKDEIHQAVKFLRFSGDILYRHTMKRDYPGLYKVLKYIDLYRSGINNSNYKFGNYYRFGIKWRGLYQGINNLISEIGYSNIIAINSLLEKGILPKDYKYNLFSYIETSDEYACYLNFAICLQPNFDWKIQNASFVIRMLYISYEYNMDVHLRFRTSIPKESYIEVYNQYRDKINRNTMGSDDYEPLAQYIIQRVIE